MSNNRPQRSWFEPELLLPWLEGYLESRPGLAPGDVYKLLYQAALGVEHFISSHNEFATFLQREWDALGAAESDPLVERIHPDGALVRVNLRPYKARNGHLPVLLGACLATAEQAWGKHDDLLAAWDAFRHASQRGAWERWPRLARPEVEAYHALIAAQAFPAVRHSDIYRQAYAPAYRVVAHELAVQLI